MREIETGTINGTAVGRTAVTLTVTIGAVSARTVVIETIVAVGIIVEIGITRRTATAMEIVRTAKIEKIAIIIGIIGAVADGVAITITIGKIIRMEVTIHSSERLDELHRNGYKIIQDRGRFCFGMDAVLLSGFARVKPGERALDIGTGTGIIPILLEAKTKGEHFTGLEIQPESADMAARSVAINDLTDKIDIVTGDIRDASERFGASSFDVITTNPP